MEYPEVDKRVKVKWTLNRMGGVEWIHLVQIREQWRELVILGTNIRAPYSARNLFTICTLKSLIRNSAQYSFLFLR